MAPSHRKRLVFLLGWAAGSVLSSTPGEAFLVQGFVKNGSGAGVAQVDVDFIDEATGLSVPPGLGDPTNSFGFYFADIPAGTYRITYNPPLGSTLAPVERTGVGIAGDTFLPDVVLPQGITVSGSVQDSDLQPVFGVDLNFLDAVTGVQIYTIRDDTDAAGAFAVVIPPGLYDITFRPPVGSTLAPKRLEAVNLPADTTLPPVTLNQGFVVSGLVKDPVGTGLENIDLDFFDAATKQLVFTIRDHTDVAGNYAVVVEPGTYNIQFIPPLPSTFAAERLANVAVAGDLALPDVVLPAGVAVTGRVIGSLGAGIAGVDLDFFDDVTGLGVFTPRDITGTDGSFRVVVVAATYNIQFIPPPGGRLLGVRLADVALPADTLLPDVVMGEGFLVSGGVFDGLGAPVAGVDLEFFDSVANAKVFTANDDTGPTGLYSVPVPAGTYTIHFVPPPGTHFLPVKRLIVAVFGDLTLTDTFLGTGVALSATVIDTVGDPVRGVDVDLFDAVSGSGIFVVNDSTDLSGFFRVVVPPGDYNVRLDPPVELRLTPLRLLGISLPADLALPPLTLMAAFLVEGFVTDSSGNPLAAVDIDFVEVATGNNPLLVGDSTDAGGFFRTAVAPGTYDVEFEPPAGLNLRPAVFAAVAIAADSVLPTAALVAGTRVTGVVQDPDGSPAANVDTDWFLAGTLQEVFTPADSTDVNGFFQVVLDPGMYDLLLVPPAGSGWNSLLVPGIAVGSSDLALPDQVLAPAVAPTVTGIAPASGTTAGGTIVQITGTGFQRGASVRFGGVGARSVTVASPIRIEAVTGPHPEGPAAVEVVNPGGLTALQLGAYQYLEPPISISLDVGILSTGVWLSWAPTGQSSYTIFRSAAPGPFTGGDIVAVTTGTAFLDIEGLFRGPRFFYVVE